MIRITSRKEGFRRAGIAHSKDAVDHPDDRFSKKELAALMDEPMLVVTDTNAAKADNKESKGEATEVTMDAIVGAIGRLPIDDPNLWSTSSDKPHVKSVEESIGEGANITATQRDEAWEIFQKAHPVSE